MNQKTRGYKNPPENETLENETKPETPTDLPTPTACTAVPERSPWFTFIRHRHLSADRDGEMFWVGLCLRGL